MTHDYDRLITAVEARATGGLDYGTLAYVTDGGTYMIASSPRLNDDGRAHDLIAVLPAAFGDDHSRVLVLRPTVNPALVAALRAALDAA